jgi:hypothetical protein
VRQAAPGAPDPGASRAGSLPARLRRSGRAVTRSPWFSALLLLAALTAILTWPQALYLGDRVVAHDDPYLSMWRLGWIAHVLATPTATLANANIFHPSQGTFAYSDMTLLEGLAAAPWLWAGANPVLVYNLLLLGGLVASGLAMFGFVRHVTRNDRAALVSATVFAFAPYRITHFVHLELQWAMWMPLAFWAVHRVFEHGRLRDGIRAGVFISLQLLSCVYYGAFLAIMVALLSAVLAAWRLDRVRTSIGPLALGGALAAATAWVYAAPYVENARVLGTRDPSEIAVFSAKLASYVTAPPVNWLWGWTGSRVGGDELHLFLGLSASVLGIIGLIGSRGEARRLAWTYLAMFVAALELSLGLNGTVYPWMHDTFYAMQGFRAPARFAILAVAALSVLAGLGLQVVARRAAAFRWGRGLPALALVLIGLESGSVPRRLDEIPRQAPELYHFLAAFERGAVVELPFRDLAPNYMYWSKEHWLPLVNGYSGHAPPTYQDTVDLLAGFPDRDSIARLRQLEVRYVVIHQAYYPEERYLPTLLDLMKSSEFVSLGRYRDWVGVAEVFELKKTALPPIP